MVDYIRIPLGVFINIDKILIPRVDETLWRSLAPFGVVSVVDSVQSLIT